jgi:hypothetical protein
MYKDIITYELAKDVSEEQLLTVAKKIVNSWMKNQKGFIKWEIHANNEGRYTDIVYWETAEDAKLAEKEMLTIPDAGEWYGCYKEGSISSKNLRLIGDFY